MARSIDPIVGLVLLPLLLYVAQISINYLRTPNYQRDYCLNIRNIHAKSRPRDNVQYLALVWYLKEVLSFAAGQYTNVNCDDDGEDVIPNYVLTRVFGTPTFTFHQVVFRISATFSEDKHNEVSTLSLTVPSKNQAILAELLRISRSEYRKYRDSALASRRKQKRRVFTPNGYRWYETDIKINKNFNNVFMDNKIKVDLLSDIDQFLQNQPRYVEDGIPHKRGYLFYGPPGVGKTSIYYALADRIKSDIYKLSLSQMSCVAELLGLIRTIATGSLVVIDDIDRIDLTNKVKIVKAPDANDSFDSSDGPPPSGRKSTNITIQTLLEIFDGYDHLSDCIIVFTTNNINKLDDALIRPGRIDRKYLIDLPNAETLKEIYSHFYHRDITGMIEPQLLEKISLSSAKIINTLILPHRDDIQASIEELTRCLRESKSDARGARVKKHHQERDIDSDDVQGEKED